MAWYTPVPQNDPPSTESRLPDNTVVTSAGCRAAHSCDKVFNNLYIFGGWNGKKALNDLYVLDLDHLAW